MGLAGFWTGCTISSGISQKAAPPGESQVGILGFGRSIESDVRAGVTGVAVAWYGWTTQLQISWNFSLIAEKRILA